MPDAPSFEQIKEAIAHAINKLMAQDSYLLMHNVNERSLTHKLGEYLQQSLAQFNVDCEYNRMLDRNGRVVRKTIILWEAMNTIRSKHSALRGERDNLSFDGRPVEDARGRVSYFLQKTENGKERVLPIYPDIICHTRGSKRNLLVIEAKKSSNNDKAAKAFDLVKLMAMVEQLGYKYGFYIDFPCGNAFVKQKSFDIQFIKYNDIADSYPVYKIIIGGAA